MWIGLAIGAFIGTAQGIKTFRTRHEPEPPNSRLKLPFFMLCFGVLVAFAVGGTSTVVFSVLATVCAVEIGFILAGRNPWWMQAPIDKREYARYQSAPPHDLDPSR